MNFNKILKVNPPVTNVLDIRLYFLYNQYNRKNKAGECFMFIKKLSSILFLFHRTSRPVPERNYKSGSTMIFTMIMVLILMLLGFTIIYMMRNESQQAFNYVESSTAHYIAEAGVEHAMYVLQNNVNDFVNDSANVGWNKLFATKNEFTFNVPFTDQRDELSAYCQELKKPLDAEIASKISGGSILSLTVSYKLSEEIDEYRKIGTIKISSTAKYKNIKRKVEVEKEVFLFKDIPIQFDHVLYVNNLTPETIPGRRDKGNSGLWRKIKNFINSRYVPQHFFVNGYKVFMRDFTIPINKEADPSWFGAFETRISMIDKLSNDKVDANVELTELKEHRKILSSLASLFTGGAFSPIKEFDEDIKDGGSRGNTDLTGFDPLNSLQKFFVAIGFKSKKDVTPNQLYGDIKRTYAFNGQVVVQPYITPGSAGDKNSWYNGPVDVSPELNAKYPKDKIIGVLEPSVYSRISQKKPVANDTVVYKVGNKLESRKVKKYYGWGPWAAAPSSKGLLGPIKDLFKVKTGKQAALANPSYAIQLKGYEFVDGDVHIEGYYQGRGVIVATGNIYIGNELLRHPDDRSGIPEAYEYPAGEYAANSRHNGAYNSLQLVALGTKPSSYSGEETGKIILRSTKDDQFAESNVLKSLFSSRDKNMELQVYLYAKNGIKSEFGDDSWFGNDTNKMYTIVNGNLVSEKIGATDHVQYLPDEMALLEDKVWTQIFDDLAKSQDKIVVAITPKIINYTQDAIK